MTASLLPNGKQQFIDINGRPLVGGTVGMFVPSTLIPKNTWQDENENVLNTNPIVLDSRGQALIYGVGEYRQIVRDQAGNLIWDEIVNPIGFNPNEISGVLYIGDGTTWTGDIGAQLNAAYAALPSTGGKIIINPKTGGGKYNFSTPVVMTTAGKYPVIEMSAPGGADSSEGCSINFVPTTGTAFTFDYATHDVGPPAPSNGMRDVTLINNDGNSTGGSGSSATAILIGNTNGGDWDATYLNVMVQGFGMGYDNPNNTAVTQVWINPTFIANTTALRVTQATVHMFGGQFAANGRVFLQPAGTAQGEFYFHGVTFFDNTGAPTGDNPVFDFNTSTSKANLFFDHCHLENSPVLSAHYVEGAVNVTMIGGLIDDDNATGASDWMFKLSNFAVIVIRDTLILAQRTQTCIVDASNECRGSINVIVGSPSNITTLVAGTFAAEFSYSAVVPYGTAQIPTRFSPPVIFGDVPQFGGGHASGSASAILGAAAPALTSTSPYSWVDVKAADGTLCTMPMWKKA